MITDFPCWGTNMILAKQHFSYKKTKLQWKKEEKKWIRGGDRKIDLGKNILGEKKNKKP